jgi:hypothetical protein
MMGILPICSILQYGNAAPLAASGQQLEYS